MLPKSGVLPVTSCGRSRAGLVPRRPSDPALSELRTFPRSTRFSLVAFLVFLLPKLQRPPLASVTMMPAVDAAAAAAAGPEIQKRLLSLCSPRPPLASAGVRPPALWSACGGGSPAILSRIVLPTHPLASPAPLGGKPALEG